MLISKEVEIKLGTKNHTRLKRKYKIDEKLNPGDKALIGIDDLSKGSHLFVDISCDYCGKELCVPYKRYNLSTRIVDKYACTRKECSNQKIKDVCIIKYNVENPFKSEDVKMKIKKTLNDRYGVDHPMFMKETKDKIKETCIDRYGVDSYRKTEECELKIRETCLEKYGVSHSSKTLEHQLKTKKTRINKGSQIPDDLLPEFFIYRRLVDNLTSLIKNEIMEKWDGYDYYDNEYIRSNFNLLPSDRNYPNFDHKVSVLYGFKNGIDPNQIGKVDNICITKAWINCTKGSKCKNPLI